MQKKLKGVYSWNKMWSLKSLVMLKCESRTSLMQYNMSDSQALFLCSALIILRMAILDILFFVLQDSKPGFVLSLLLNFLPKPRLLFI